jgi:hypothetical protein
MLTNPMETQLVSSLGIRVGGRTVPEQPLELLRGSLATGTGDAFAETETATETETGRGRPFPSPSVQWSAAAQERLARVPSFVRGMVKKIYTDYARERGITTITPDIMDRARTDLGLEGM